MCEANGCASARRVLPPLPGLMRAFFAVLVLMGFCPAVRAESPAKPAPGSVQVMFLPPPLEEGAVYSVGVYETKTGRLVRRLHEDAEDGAFTAGLNGFITFWDRKDDAGKTVPAGRYAARGWAVGEMKVEGVDILGNEWTEGDENLRIKRVIAFDFVFIDGGLVLLAEMAGGDMELLRVGGRNDAILWHRPVTNPATSIYFDDEIYCRKDDVRYALSDGHEITTPLTLKCGTVFYESRWMTTARGLFKLREKDFSELDLPEKTEINEVEVEKRAVRSLFTEPSQPVPIRLTPWSAEGNRVYLLEESPGWQRLRGLEWLRVNLDATGHPVSEWRTFFERSIRRPDPALGLDENAPSPVVELPLAKNPLEPGKPQRARLRAGFDAAGSYLATADGVRLLPVSNRANLRAARLARDPKDPGRLLFYQFDGAAWDVFSVTGAPGALVGFDAGEFELTADGERHPERPTTEPRTEP